MKSIFKALWLLCLSTTLTACAGNGIRWTEEVKLSDGKIIQLQRRTELTESGFPVQKRGFYKYHEICYPPMGIRWKSMRGYQPDIFDIVDGKAYMHVPISDCEKCRLHGFPASNALYFTWEINRWKRIAHGQFPEKSEWNLLMSIKAAPGHEQDDPHSLMTIADKERRQSSARYEQKHRGWKRVSDADGWRDSCNKCGRANPSPEVPPEILFTDDKNKCNQ